MEPKNELQRNAVAEARRKELESYQRALDIQWLNNRMEDGRMGRCLALVQREAEMEKDFQERTDHAAIVNARAEEEAKLGLEILKVKNEHVNELMRRHYLRERDPSLRELQKKLQAGYVSRDLQQQIQNNEYRKLQDKVEQSEVNRVMLNALYNETEVSERKAKAKIERNTQYCKELQQQLVNKQRQRQCQYEDTLIEKKMLEDIVRTIADEDQREIQQKIHDTNKMREEMKTFQQAREAWMQKQKEMVLIEERKIEEQCRAASDRSASIVAQKEKKQQLREEHIKKMGEKLLAEAAVRQEREDTIRLLQEQEYLEKNVQDDISGRLKAQEFRERAQRDDADRRAALGRARRAHHERDAHVRQQMADSLALDNEKEREKERIKKQKNQQYGIELRKQIENNAQRRKVEQEAENKRNQSEFDYVTAWRSEVSQERKKIVQEHVPQLIGYLQAGVIKHDDLPVVRERAKSNEELPKLDIESMAVSNGPLRFSKCNEQCKVLREY